METKWFRYPPNIQWTKTVSKVMIFILAMIFIAMVYKNRPEDYETLSLYYIAFTMPILGILVFALYAGSWSDLGINDQGIVVEFLWFQLSVPWNSIISTKQVGSMKFGVFVILTKDALTPLHRIYSLITVGSFHPSIQIHSISSEHLSAVGLIKTNLKNRSSLK